MVRNIVGERAVFLPDVHVPYQDEKAVKAALAFIRFFKPHHVWLLGDVIDFYSISRFRKDPKRNEQLQDDLDETCDFLKRVRDAAPRAKRHYIFGNHEARLRNYLWTDAAALNSLRSLRLHEQLHLVEYGFKWYERGWTRWHDIIVKHGNIVRQQAGASAHAELLKNGLSGVSGHTHRLGQAFKTNAAGIYTWVESGCLAKTTPEYLEGQQADWQHGLTIGFVKKHSTRFSLSPIPIIDGTLLFDLKTIC